MKLELDVEAAVSQEFDHTQNVNFRLIEGQEKMSALNLKSQKASVLPTLAGFYNYGTNGMGDKMDRNCSGSRIQLQDCSFQFLFLQADKGYHNKKAQINLEKARTTKDMVTDQLLLQEKQLRYNLVNANQQYISQKDNIDVSKESMQAWKTNSDREWLPALN